MPRRPNQRAQKFEDHEARVAKAIQEINDHPDAKLLHIAKANHLAPNTIYNRLNHRTQDARSAQADVQNLSLEENAVVRWVESRDSLGLPPKHEELRRMALHIINSRGTTKVEHIGDHWTARFIARHPEIATMVAHAMDRERAFPAIGKISRAISNGSTMSCIVTISIPWIFGILTRRASSWGRGIRRM